MKKVCPLSPEEKKHWAASKRAVSSYIGVSYKKEKRHPGGSPEHPAVCKEVEGMERRKEEEEGEEAGSQFQSLVR